jgi:nucleotide-binding universal stress UspA family protein
MSRIAGQEDDMETTDTQAARVVVGYDASPAARAAVEWAVAEADRRALPLTVVHAADYTGLVGGPISMSPALPGVSVDQAKRIAEGGAELARARRSGVEVRATTFAGAPSTVLIAESRAAAIVVVGTRGHGDVAGVLLGSVASRVAAHAQCPVVVVRGADGVVAGTDRPVVVGVDGSPSAGAALAAAIGRATEAGAALRIVCAWRPTAPGDWEREYWLAVGPGTDPDETARKAAERVVADAAEAVRRLAPDLTVETSVRGGDAAAVVLDAAGDAGLVVVGARGRGSLASLLLGSVSHGVVHGARCPVMIVRAPASEPGEAEAQRSSGTGSWRPVGLL